jgi:molecular chaperone IbpA
MYDIRISNTSPFYNLGRSFIGYDKLFDEFEKTLSIVSKDKYPFYNIQKKDKQTIIEVACSGFKKEELEVSLDVTKNVLTVKGQKNEKDAEEYVIKTISSKSFTKQFRISDHLKIQEVEYADGMLTITLNEEVPEEQKPKIFKIK